MSSADYWRKREAEALKENQKQEKDYDKQVAEIYQQMIDECDVDIKTFYARYASKEGITMAEAKKRADKLDIEEYGRKAKKYVKDKDFSDQANEEMRLYNMTMKVNRLELLKAELGLEMTAGSDELQKKLGVMLDDRARESYKRQAGILGKTVPDADTYGRMMDTIVNGSFHNATWSQRIWANQEALRSRVNALLVRGLIGGRNPREMARDLTRTVQSSQSNAERLMRTELARVQIGAQQQAIADAGYDEYTFLAIGTACGDCRALDEKTFKLKKMMPGENAPPMHPNCRCSVCAAMSDEEFRKLTGVDPVKLDPGASDKAAKEKIKEESKGQERESAYIHDDGKRDTGHVNLALVNTKKYHDKFENLSNHKAVNESLYQESMVILGDRNNTEYEDIVAVDARSGKVLEKNTSAAQCGYKHSCGFTLEQYQGLEKRGKAYEVLHNHPNSSVPSRDDIRKLFERDKQTASTICCHNGNVYRMEKLKPNNDIAVLEEKAYTYCKEKYAYFDDEKIEYECSSRMIKMLLRRGYLKFTKR
jgi:SPP1 gp7 family putative phage head morphogenesis protein